MARVAIVFTGGTISMLPNAVSGAAVPSLRGAAILARVSGLAEIAEVVAVDWGLVPASHLSMDQILELARLVDGMLANASPERAVDGVVVVQGTDTIEETAFAFDLLIGGAKPLVVVGAMRNAAHPEWDGPANVRDAVRVCVARDAGGQGTMVVMAGSVLAADDAVKWHTGELDAFRAPNSGALGRVTDGRVTFDRRRGSRRRLEGVPERAAEPVFLVTATVGMDGAALRLLGASRPRGFVVAATGAGNTHPDLLAAAVEHIANGVPVVLASRSAAGGATGAYGFPGGGRTWLDAGVMACGTLSGPKARIALSLGLGAGLDNGDLRALLQGPGGSPQ